MTIRRDPRLVQNLTSLMVGVLGIVGLCNVSQAHIQFEDKTATAGPFHVGESYGVTVVDFNADGRPDIFANNHRLRPGIYRNNGKNTANNLTFSQSILEVDTSDTLALFSWGGPDTHGAASGDFDGDGDQDLYVTTGDNAPGLFFVTEGGAYVNRTNEFNLFDDKAGRDAVWLDYNNDALTDLVVLSTGGCHMWKQTPTGPTKFTKVTGTVGMNCTSGFFGQLADLDADGRLELILAATSGDYPHKIYRTTTTGPFQDVTTLLPLTASTTDAALADFNNDGRTDVFLTRGKLHVNEVQQISATRIEASLNGPATRAGAPPGGIERGFSFTSTGRITITLNTDQIGPGEIYFGSSGSHPVDTKTFTLDPANPDHHGIAPHVPNTNKGLYTGLNTTTNKWEVWLSPGSGGASGETRGYIQAVNGDPGVTLTNMTIFPNSVKAADLPMTPRLLMNTPSGFQDETFVRGLSTPISCSSVVAADFDNDMDLDLFIVCRGGVQNLPDLLYENDGFGNFEAVPGAGGAQGPIGKGINSQTGTGDSVALADYDTDGFLDLFETNGLNIDPDRLGGPDQIILNRSAIAQAPNPNHWVEIDLVGKVSDPSGIVSSRDATGAMVRVTAGGVTQVREQNGEYHRWSQNHQRLHFGLEGNTQATIEVVWPSGRVDTFSSVQADALYRVSEGSASDNGTIEQVTLGPVPPYPAPQINDECGVPVYVPLLDAATFLYRDCVNGVWSIRVTAEGSSTNVKYQGKLDADQPFTVVEPFNLEFGDIPSPTAVYPFSATPPFAFSLNTSWGNIDGFDFVSDGLNECLTLSLPANARVLVGPDRKSAPMPFNLTTFQTCIAPPPPPPGLQPGDECGVPAPAIQNSVEKAIFLYRDCSAPNGIWTVRATSGGSATVLTYNGNVTSAQGFSSITSFSFEGGDILNNSPATQITYELNLYASGIDGFSFRTASEDVTDNNCFGVTNLPAGAQVLVGPNREIAPATFNLNTFGACI